MNSRQEILLSRVIKEYIKTAQPVSSSFLVNKYFVDLSSATLRNDLNELERQGYLTHPHTSAGRVPTEAGYRYYLANFLTDKETSVKNKQALTRASQIHQEYRLILKNLAKTIAELTNNTVVIGFAQQDVYYTGLANLFSQPEFQDIDFVCDVSEIIDHLDEVMNNLLPQITEQEIKILLGSDNPVNVNCGLIIINYHYRNQQGIIGILGPMRMNYELNQALIKFVQEILR